MEITEAIKGRRSIRKFKTIPISLTLIRDVLKAGTWAPSAKNGQQWRFTVLTDYAKKKFTTFFRSQLQARTKRTGGKHMGSSFKSCRIMEQAPVLVLVWNINHHKIWNVDQDKMIKIREPSIQGVAAAIQNMLLKAYSLGLGSLWICDIYYTLDALEGFFNKPWELMAAVAFGWPESIPEPPPRLSVDEVSDFIYDIT
jgi:nitroreductase